VTTTRDSSVAYEIPALRKGLVPVPWHAPLHPPNLAASIIDGDGDGYCTVFMRSRGSLGTMKPGNCQKPGAPFVGESSADLKKNDSTSKSACIQPTTDECTNNKKPGQRGRRTADKGLSVSPELSGNARAPRDCAGFCRDEKGPVAPRHRACLPVGQVFYYLGVPVVCRPRQNVHCGAFVSKATSQNRDRPSLREAAVEEETVFHRSSIPCREKCPSVSTLTGTNVL